MNPTPPPPASDLQCVVYTVRRTEGDYGVKITDMAPQADGSLWLTAVYYDGYYAHVPAGQTAGEVILDPAPIGGDFTDTDAVIVSRAGKTWFATGAGLVELAGSTWITHTVDLPDFRPSQVRDVAEQPDGTLWVQAYSGFAQFDPQTGAWQRLYLPDFGYGQWLGRAADGRLRGVSQDRDHLVFVGRDAAGAVITTTVGHPDIQVGVAALALDSAARSEVWWFGGPLMDAPGQPSEGLDALARLGPDGGWTLYTRSSTAGGLSGDAILALAALPDELLIGTAASGLLRARPERGEWRSYTVADGLPADSITGIAVESDHSFWLSACDRRREDCPHSVDRYLTVTANLLAHCTLGAAAP